MGNLIKFTFHNVSINSNPDAKTMFKWNKFTFHNVSINSLYDDWIEEQLSKFTFHNVSINSCAFIVLYKLQHQNLHSIMYLLIPDSDMKQNVKAAFTFHNVSINS